jgi:hypothetical protein
MFDYQMVRRLSIFSQIAQANQARLPTLVRGSGLTRFHKGFQLTVAAMAVGFLPYSTIKTATRGKP